VAEGVVVLLEAIEVEEQQVQRLVARGLAEQRVEVRHERASIAELREGVGARLVAADGEQAAQLELGDHLARQGRERVALLEGQLVRDVVERAQGPDGEPIVGDERCAGVEAQADLGHERPVGEAGIRREVWDDERLVLENRVRAEGDLTWAVGGRVASGLRLEPHALGVDQAHHGHRGAADLRREADDVVVRPLALGIEDAVAVQRPEALELVLWLGGDEHGRRPPGPYARGAMSWWSARRTPPLRAMVRRADD
jgi:hypothetical protein